MNHSFIAGALDKTKCNKCGRIEMDHTKFAQCEACPTKSTCEIVNGMLLCKACADKELAVANTASNEPKQIEYPVIKESDAVSRLARKLELTSIETSEQYFNAEILSIAELEKQIQSDDSIPRDKKNFELARKVQMMHEHLKPILFEAMDVQREITSKMRAHVVFLNEFANKLRETERAELKLKDINYVPKQVSPKPTAIKPAKSDRQITIDKLVKSSNPIDRLVGNYMHEMKDRTESEVRVIVQNMLANAAKMKSNSDNADKKD